MESMERESETNNISSKELPLYLVEYAQIDRVNFERLVAKYVHENETVLDICSGFGRTYEWIKSARPSANVICADIDFAATDSLKENGIKTYQFDINQKWPDFSHSSGKPAFDTITSFGGFNCFVDWHNLMLNVALNSKRHIFHFNRNDTKDAISMIQNEFYVQKYFYTAYSIHFIYDLYNRSAMDFFKIVEIAETPISYIVYAETR